MTPEFVCIRNAQRKGTTLNICTPFGTPSFLYFIFVNPCDFYLVLFLSITRFKQSGLYWPYSIGVCFFREKKQVLPKCTAPYMSILHVRTEIHSNYNPKGALSLVLLVCRHITAARRWRQLLPTRSNPKEARRRDRHRFPFLFFNRHFLSGPSIKVPEK